MNRVTLSMDSSLLKPSGEPVRVIHALQSVQYALARAKSMDDSAAAERLVNAAETVLSVLIVWLRHEWALIPENAADAMATIRNLT
jgi:hypothetical protein